MPGAQVSEDDPQGRSIWMGVSIAPGCELGVRFTWCEDRFRHWVEVHRQVDVHSAPRVTPLAESIDGGDDLAWPASPAIQQLDECELGAHRRGLVGLGMAGTSHWSLAVEAIEGGIWLDVACRVQQRGGHLQSSYRIPAADPPSLLSGSDSRQSQYRFRPPGLGIALTLKTDPRNTTVSEDPADEHAFRVRPYQQPEEIPGTVRWRFGFVHDESGLNDTGSDAPTA